MFRTHMEIQHASYNEAMRYYSDNFESIIKIEEFVMNEIRHFIDLHSPEIKRDYNEASYLYPFSIIL